MTQRAFRFLHSGDLHLERPLGGVAEVPEHLRDVFLDAPYRAAEQVFETALAEGVDAMILAGDVLDFDLAGPRAVVFLAEQFRRLGERGIPVYWAAGQVDPADGWPGCVPLPENVHIFPVGRVGQHELRRDGDLLALIQGISAESGVAPDDAGFHRDVHGTFTIGVSHGTSSAAGTEGDRVHYMALGGEHQRKTVDVEPGIAHYAGTPQGRDPSETGAKGCTLVSVDDAGNVKTSLVVTDAVRWITEEVEVTAGTDEEALLAQLESRVAKLQTKHQGAPLLVTWRVTGRGSVVNHIRPGGVSDQMTELLREQFGRQTPCVWTLGLECPAPLDVPQEWVDEETIMGDMLREFRELEADPDIELDLADFLPAELRTSPRARIAKVSKHERPALLWAASKMAVDLLDGEEVISG